MITVWLLRSRRRDTTQQPLQKPPPSRFLQFSMYRIEFYSFHFRKLLARNFIDPTDSTELSEVKQTINKVEIPVQKEGSRGHHFSRIHIVFHSEQRKETCDPG